MAEAFYVGAYWGPRVEPAGECAERLARCLGQLGAAHPLLATWFRKGGSRAAASKNPVAADKEALEALLMAGRSRTDVGGQVMSELGFSAALWNGNDLPASFSTACGASPPTPSIMNTFVLQLPEPSGAGLELYDPKTARAVFDAVVQAWEPEWATFSSHSLREAQAAVPGRPVAGWLTYVTAPPATPGAGVSVEEYAGGTCYVAGTDPLHVPASSVSAVVELVAAA